MVYLTSNLNCYTTIAATVTAGPDAFLVSIMAALDLQNDFCVDYQGDIRAGSVLKELKVHF